MGVVLILLSVVAVNLLYAEIAYRSLRSRDLDTALPPARLRELFAETVAGFGWRIVEDGDPYVAESGLLTLSYQRIGLTLEPLGGGRTEARVDVLRYSGQWLVPFPHRPHTIRWRINAFVRAVLAEDPTARDLT